MGFLHLGVRNMTNLKTNLSPVKATLAQLGAEFGLDKAPWGARITHGIKCFAQLKAGTIQCETSIQESYFQALINMELGNEVNTPIKLDWGSSCTSLISAIMRDEIGMTSSGALAEQPMDVYGQIRDALGININRKPVKECTIPYVYGGTSGVIHYLVPAIRELPGMANLSDKDGLKLYERAYRKPFPGGFEWRKQCLKAWDSTKCTYGWYLPDGYQAYFNVTENVTSPIEFYNSKGEKVSLGMTMPIPTNKEQGEGGTFCIGAHLIQAMDGYVLREIVRRGRTSFLRAQAKLLKASEEELAKDVSTGIQRAYKGYVETGIVSLHVLEILKEETTIPQVWYTDIMSELTLLQGDFEVLPVHDEFGVLPGQVDALRKTANAVYAGIYRGSMGDYLNHKLNLGIKPRSFNPTIYNRLLNSDYLIN